MSVQMRHAQQTSYNVNQKTRLQLVVPLLSHHVQKNLANHSLDARRGYPIINPKYLRPLRAIGPCGHEVLSHSGSKNIQFGSQASISNLQRLKQCVTEIDKKAPEELCFRNMMRQKTVGRAPCLRHIPLNHRNSIQVPCLTCTVQMYNASCLSVVPAIPVASFFMSLCLLVCMSLSLSVHLSLFLYISMSL